LRRSWRNATALRFATLRSAPKRRNRSFSDPRKAGRVAKNGKLRQSTCMNWGNGELGSPCPVNRHPQATRRGCLFGRARRHTPTGY
jgi:hypothetical protein